MTPRAAETTAGPVTGQGAREMTRHPAPIHDVPLDAPGRHVPSTTCPCRPIQAVDMLEPGRVVVVHRHAPEPRGLGRRPNASPPLAQPLVHRPTLALRSARCRPVLFRTAVIAAVARVEAFHP